MWPSWLPLQDLLARPERYTESYVATHIIKPLLSVLAYLHSKSIMHRCVLTPAVACHVGPHGSCHMGRAGVCDSRCVLSRGLCTGSHMVPVTWALSHGQCTQASAPAVVL